MTPQADSDQASLTLAEYLFGGTMLRPWRLAYGLAPIISVLEQHRVPIAPLLADARIPRFALEEPSYRISLEQELSFFRAALRRLDLPTAGIEVGQQFNLALFGVVGLAASCAPTVRDLFRTVPEFPTLCWGSNELAVWREGDEEYLALYPDDRFGDIASFFVERDATAALVLFRQTLGADLAPASVRFAHSPPADTAPYDALFRCPVRFGDGVNQIRFARATWDAVPPQANSMSYRFYINQCRRLSELMTAPLSYADVVRSRLRAATPVPDFDQLVDELHLSGRTLQRRLAEEGTSFSVLLADVRLERAREMLGRGGMHNDEIARVLGFAEASAFSRAFKHWTGASPQAYLRGLGVDDAQ